MTGKPNLTEEDPEPQRAAAGHRDSIADGLVGIVRLHDVPTAEHLDAVGTLTFHLCSELRFDADFTERVVLAARLHDVGKERIPVDILRKPDSLTASEWASMAQHADHSATILGGFSQLADLAPIVRAHHERIDGAGYPDHLVGTEIPLEARIIAVPDAFHAMTSIRPYTPVRSPVEAIAELQRCSGTQFEPEVVRAFVALIGRRFATVEPCLGLRLKQRG